MATQHGAEGVIWTVETYRNFVREIDKGYILMMGPSERGPINEPTMLAVEGDFEAKFGDSVMWSECPLTVKDCIAEGGKVIFVRICHYDDITDPSTMSPQCAKAIIPDRGGQSLPASVESAVGPFTFVQALSGRFTGSEVGPFTFGAGTSDQFSIQVGVPGDWGPTQNVTMSGSLIDAQAAADLINGGTDGLTAAATADNKLKCWANDPTKGLNLVAVSNDCYSVLGLTEGEYAAEAGTDRLVVEVNGGGDQEFDLEPLVAGQEGQFTLTVGDLLDQVETIANATAAASQGKLTLTTTAIGSGSTIQIKPASTAATALGFDTDLHEGWDGEAENRYEMEVTEPGAWGDAVKIHVHDSKLKPGERFAIRVSHFDLADEYEDDLSGDPTHERYWLNYWNLRHKRYRIVDRGGSNPYPTNMPAINDDGIACTGGDDGQTELTISDWIGDPDAGTGKYAFLKSIYPSMDAMLIGRSDATVCKDFETWVQNTAGLHGYVATPQGMLPKEAVKWRNGEPPDFTHAAFASHKLAIIFGRPTIYDAKHNTEREISALGKWAACISKTDETKGAHYAPAGYDRGRVYNVLDLDHNVGLYQADADLLRYYGINYLKMDKVNVWAESSTHEGAVIWGATTALPENDPLQELNIARFITTCELAVKPIIAGHVFDINHPVMWLQLQHELEPAFERWAAEYAIYGFMIVSDSGSFFAGGKLKGAQINTGANIELGEYRLLMLVQPTHHARWILAKMRLLSTGTVFSEREQVWELPGYVRA